MRALVVLAITATSAAAEPRWNVDVGIRGAATIAVGEPTSRSGAVPSMTIRAQRSLGPAYVGANLAAGFPAYVGQHEASLSIGLASTLRDGNCIRADLDAELDCSARLAILGGIDAGVAILHYDAPPELPATSDALLYWGPLARARAAFRATWEMPSGMELGVVVGAGVAVASAHYMTTASGTGLRVEPAIDFAGVIAF